MSFDPFSEQQPPRDPSFTPGNPNPPPGGPVPPGQSPYGQYPPPGTAQYPSASPARQRVVFPAVLLMFSGVVSLLFGGYMVFNLIVSRAITPEKQREMLAQNPAYAKALEDLEKQGYNFEQLLQVGQSVNIGLAISNGLAALLCVVGGIRMLQLRSYGLVMFASLLSLIPCVSGSGCCCIGEVAGIWSIILLLQEDVRSAFQ